MCILLYVNYSHNAIKNNKTQTHQSNQCVAVRYFVKTCKKINPWTSWWSRAKTLCSRCMGPGLTPVWGVRSHMLQLTVCMLQLKILLYMMQLKIIHTTTKAQHFLKRRINQVELPRYTNGL